MHRNSNKMWLHFKKINVNTAQCNLCAYYIKHWGNTSSMITHLKLHKIKNTADRKDTPKETKLPMRKISHRLNSADNTSHAGAGTSLETAVETHEGSLVKQMSGSLIASTFGKASCSDDDDHEAEILDAFLYYICTDYQPFSTMQCKGFKYLLKKLAPLYKIPTKNAIKRRFDEKYDAMAQIFKQKLNKVLHMTITIDTWSEAGSSKRFLGLTVHFVTSGTKKIESGNIEVIELLEHTVDWTVLAIMNIMLKWCIPADKVTAVVTNNESNIVKAAIEIFGQDKHMNCFAHIINLLAENALKNCEDLNNFINKVRSVVMFLKNNTDLTNELYRCQIDSGTSENEVKKLILDAKMKWIDIFYMIKRFVELWNMINKVLHKTPDLLTADEIVTLKEILDLLKPLEFIAKECLTDNYIAISKIMPVIKCAIAEYSKTRQTMTLSMRLKEIIVAEFERWFGLIEFSEPISIATILDPRFKTVHFVHATALDNAKKQLQNMINESYSDEFGSNGHQKETECDIWNNHKILAYEPKEKDAFTLKNQLSLYLANPLASLEDNPLEKWESMRLTYPSLYTIARKYLSIVGTSVPAERLFSKMGTATIQSRNQLSKKRLSKLLFLNSVI
ncbi:zinc finger BED domain-containing protein 4 [Solenopsis invicta]|uniref:zinc finger BED domain-containing protein 4 n=1 Tax=Solenopsis invicta TaxID=13686 RepID=UPI000596260C|nr:zinc finger BED domain-containing protein 4 [Solenopsis invicta]